MRRVQLLMLTLWFGAYSVWFLSYAESGILTTVLSNSVPVLTTIGVICAILFNKWERFKLDERMGLMCLCTLFLFYSAYVVLCAFSTPLWVKNHNTKNAIFVTTTVCFYSYTIYKLIREQQ